MEGALIPRATIDQVEAQRNQALALYAEAFDALKAAQSAHSLVAASGSYSPSLVFGSRSNAVEFAGHEREPFLARCRKEVDRGVWQFLINSTKLESLMDHKAREEFRRQLADDPPEATAANCQATLEQFIGDAPMIFKRGVAEAFSNLDRRFRSHDGFKIGARICLTYALSDWGSLNQGPRERIHDVERAFCIMDGKADPSSYGGICAAIDAARGPGLRRHPFVVETSEIRAKGYKNGNVHLWFLRDDLVDKVNLLLAEYYGEALGAGVDAAEPDAARSTAVARNMGYFPTPEAVGVRVLQSAAVHTGATHSGDYRRLSVLEPSAGDGRLASLAASAGHIVTCVELHPGRAIELRTSGKYRQTVQADFLDLSPDSLGQFDRVIMNPPFDRGLDMDHVRHAFKFLKPGGALCALMSAGTAFREGARTEAFRAWAERFKANSYAREIFEDLPFGSFRESGTMVNACLLTLRAPA